MRNLTPREIVEELNRHIVGQADAKRAVAIAVRNRWRRQHLSEEMQNEVSPKNILMIGPTGVGKTEIARRLAKLTGAPFIKIEATKFTEVGYYGRDVESMIRELVENAINLVREQEQTKVEQQAKEKVEERLLDLLVPHPVGYEPPESNPLLDEETETEPRSDAATRYERTREKIAALLKVGDLEERKVEIKITEKPTAMMFSGMGMEMMDSGMSDVLEKMIPSKSKKREVTVKEARKVLFNQECDTLINQDKVNDEAVKLAENTGIIFLDEIDKIVASEKQHGADVSRQGVQRDLLPIVEGTTVQTKYGYVKTDHILFVAAGAFHQTRPSDLMPEMQGRFPIRVELSDLTQEDFVRILTEPKTALTKQYAALLETEGVKLSFSEDGIQALAEYAFHVNQSTQNIGARRLYTMLEKLLEELSFEAPAMQNVEVEVNDAYVKQRLDIIAQDEDLSQFIL